MKTSFSIESKLLEEAMILTGKKDKNETVELALKLFLKHRKRRNVKNL